MKTYTRPLNAAQSDSCARALRKRCTCRCGGLLHGVNHSEYNRIEQQVLTEQGSITEDQVVDIINFLKED